MRSFGLEIENDASTDHSDALSGGFVELSTFKGSDSRQLKDTIPNKEPVVVTTVGSE